MVSLNSHNHLHLLFHLFCTKKTLSFVFISERNPSVHIAPVGYVKLITIRFLLSWQIVWKMSQSSLNISIWTKSLINRKKLTTRLISRISIEMEGEDGESSAQDLSASLSQKVPLKDLDVEKGSILDLRYLLNVHARILTRGLYILNRGI